MNPGPGVTGGSTYSYDERVHVWNRSTQTTKLSCKWEALSVVRLVLL